MTEEIDFTEETTETSNTLLSALRRVLMAGIGAVALSQEQIEDFVGKLVERGEIADGDARKLMSDVVDRRKRVVQDGAKKAEEEFDRRVEKILSHMNIPSKSEIDTLSTKITQLSDKVDELNEMRRR